MAHVHSQTLSKQQGGAGTSLLIPRVAASARNEAIVVVGSIPAVAVYLAFSALGATPSESTFTASFCLVALLFTMGCLGGRQAELTAASAPSSRWSELD
jgi:hypothetical protein